MIDADLSRRIAILRFLMIFGVVVVHTPPAPDAWEVDGSLAEYIVSFFQNGLFRAGVPVLTVISGFLLFSANADLNYSALLRKKASTLLVPFLIFNFGHIIAQMIVRVLTGRWLGEDLLAQSLHGWLDILFSVWTVPANAPLHFLRELMVLVVLAPVFGICIRKIPVLGLIIVCSIFLFNLEVNLINRNDMPINFYIGGLAAIYRWNYRLLDRFSYASLFVIVFVCVLISILEIGNIIWLRLMAPALVWSAASLVASSIPGKWFAQLSKYSFFIFVTHAAIIRMAWIIFERTLPSIPVYIFSLIAPFVVVVICIGLYRGLSRLAPNQLDWALGSRGEKSKSKTSRPKEADIAMLNCMDPDVPNSTQFPR